VKYEAEIPIEIKKQIECLLQETVIIQTQQMADLRRIESYFCINLLATEPKIESLFKDITIKDTNLLETNRKYCSTILDHMEGLRVEWTKNFSYIKFFSESVITGSEESKRRRTNLKHTNWLMN